MENQKTSSDEIDLQELLLKFVLIIKGNITIIISFFLIGSLLGFTHGMLGTKVYESNMLVASDLLTESYVDILGENLNNILKDRNTELLAEKLKLSNEQAKLISNIEITSVLKEKPIENVTVDQGVRRTFFLGITVDVLDPELLPDLQKGLINYLQSNEFVSKRVQQRVHYYNETIKKLDEEILSLEMFKKKIYDGDFLQSTKGNMMFDPTEVNSKIIILNDSKLKNQTELGIVNSIQVVEGFTKFNRPISPNKAVSMAAGASLGILFVVLLIAFKSIRTLVRMAEKK